MPTRRERTLREQARVQRQQQRKRIMLLAAGLVITLVVVVLGVATTGALSQAAPTRALQAANPAVTCNPIQTFPEQSRDHIKPGDSHPAYSSNPPTSGWHWDTPKDWGIYATAQVQEQLVHNLEHGGVIIQYKDLSTEEVARLEQLAKSDSRHLILAPYPGMPEGVRVAITAWDHLQTCTGVDENAIKGFISAYRDKGPELVP